ncbi:protein Lilipod [Trichonephila inaurata madagascariensis]|uniref:Protein Lilipod n=1 Tax=Trichonephila inaurata madagascariensis TaxID=2747483 RepID=A0A8X6WSP0_9ARAC|nr:protein Lilipod [Trichonephila inaurata madagascariensis]
MFCFFLAGVSTHYLPFLYSCVSFLGVLMLLICTPIGFARLFTAIGKLLVKLKAHTPRCHVQDDQIKDISGDDCFSLESSGDGTFNLRDPGYSPFNLESSGDGSYCLGSSGNNPFKFKSSGDCPPFEICEDGPHNLKKFGDNIFKLKSGLRRSPTASSIHRRRTYHSIPFEEYEENRSTYFNEEGLDRIVAFLQTKESKIRHAAFKRNFLYPFMMIFLLLLTVLSMLMVAQNTLELCFGVKALPIYSENISLGINSLSSLGPVGACFEIILILYLWCTSIIGLYSLPLFCYLRPKVRGTSMTQVIGNCAILLILSSALPVLARSLGITNFDLLGDFGRINWLGNFYIVLFHNILFAVTTAICLGTKITATVRNELYLRIRNIRYSILYVVPWVFL